MKAFAILFAIGAVMLSVFDITRGAFRHLQPDFLGIPDWLPGIYLVSGTVLGQLSRKVFAA